VSERSASYGLFYTLTGSIVLFVFKDVDRVVLIACATHLDMSSLRVDVPSHRVRVGVNGCLVRMIQKAEGRELVPVARVLRFLVVRTQFAAIDGFHWLRCIA
jgi:hypothetical protein